MLVDPVVAGDKWDTRCVAHQWKQLIKPHYQYYHWKLDDSMCCIYHRMTIWLLYIIATQACAFRLCVTCLIYTTTYILKHQVSNLPICWNSSFQVQTYCCSNLKHQVFSGPPDVYLNSSLFSSLVFVRMYLSPPTPPCQVLFVVLTNQGPNRMIVDAAIWDSLPTTLKLWSLQNFHLRLFRCHSILYISLSNHMMLNYNKFNVKSFSSWWDHNFAVDNYFNGDYFISIITYKFKK